LSEAIAMPDPSWIDSSTIAEVAAGDTALEAELAVRRNAGTELLVVPKVKEEVTIGNPLKRKGPWQTTAEQAKACQEVMERLGMKLDTRGSEADRRELFERQFKFKGPGQGTVVRAVEKSDAIILSQVAASARARNVARPEFVTRDLRLVNNADAKLWGVNIVPPTGRPPMPSGPGGGTGAGGGADEGGGGQPGGPAPSPGQSAAERGRLRGLVGAVAGAVGVALVGIIATELRRRMEQRIIERQLRELEPAIVERVAALKAQRPPSRLTAAPRLRSSMWKSSSSPVRNSGSARRYGMRPSRWCRSGRLKSMR
jgi:hypothetical protein